MREFTLLMLAHVLGDYWFQPQSLARAKSRSLGWVLLHALIYAAACASMLIFLGGGFIFALAAAAVFAGVQLVIAAFGGFKILADFLLLFGSAVVLLALGLLFLWIFIWFVGSVMAGLVTGVIALGRSWCYKEVSA